MERHLIHLLITHGEKTRTFRSLSQRLALLWQTGYTGDNHVLMPSISSNDATTLVNHTFQNQADSCFQQVVIDEPNQCIRFRNRSVVDWDERRKARLFPKAWRNVDVQHAHDFVDLCNARLVTEIARRDLARPFSLVTHSDLDFEISVSNTIFMDNDWKDRQDQLLVALQSDLISPQMTTWVRVDDTHLVFRFLLPIYRRWANASAIQPSKEWTTIQNHLCQSSGPLLIWITVHPTSFKHAQRLGLLPRLVLARLIGCQKQIIDDRRFREFQQAPDAKEMREVARSNHEGGTEYSIRVVLDQPLIMERTRLGALVPSAIVAPAGLNLVLTENHEKDGTAILFSFHGAVPDEPEFWSKDEPTEQDPPHHLFDRLFDQVFVRLGSNEFDMFVDGNRRETILTVLDVYMPRQTPLDLRLSIVEYLVPKCGVTTASQCP